MTILTLHKIRLHHPLFSKVSANSFKYILETTTLQKYKPGQYLYQKGQPVKDVVYFIMYGTFFLTNGPRCKFGIMMCAGHTLGEESLLSQQAERTECCRANDHACVLVCGLQPLQNMRVQKHVQGGCSNFLKDYAMMMYVLESHFVQKEEWRRDAELKH
jgi:CRP-like cAMP-binding protein